MMSDSFLYSGDDAAVSQCKSVASGAKLGCQLGTSLAFAPECILTFPQECTC